VILVQPASQITSVGGVAQFTVGVSGTAPLTVQWLRNGHALPGATGAVLTRIAAADDEGARFSAIVSNALGSAASTEAVLTLCQHQPCALAGTLSLVGTVAADIGGRFIADPVQQRGNNPTVQVAGPECGLAQCSSRFVANSDDPTSPGPVFTRSKRLLVILNSTGAPPGFAPGSGVTQATVSFVIDSPVASVTGGYVTGCAFAQGCAEALQGLTVDLQARTLTFDRYLLTHSQVPSRTLTLTGVLRY
jgi:hypothetical protein